jgi:hypothetical protein
MSPQLLVFYAAAALALLGALLALTRTRPQAALRWFGLTLGALVVIEHQLIAPTIALLSLLFFAAAAAYLAVIAGHAEATPPASAALNPPARRLRLTRATYARALPLLAVLALAWVFTGTWARQHAWPGQELAPSAGFGGLSALTSALAGPHIGALIAVVLLVLVAAVGGLALLGAGDGARR